MFSLAFALLAPSAQAASLPGISIPFDLDAQGQLVLGHDLPQPLVDAGAEPGWRLTAVDDTPVPDGITAERLVATGGSRIVHLKVVDPSPPAPAPPPPPGTTATYAPNLNAPVTEAVLVVRRADLVHAVQEEVIAWPSGFQAPAKVWQEDFTGAPVAVDQKGGSWRLDPNTAAFTALEGADRPAMTLPSVFWALTNALWAVERPTEVASGETGWAQAQFAASAVRVRGFHGRSGDTLLASTPAGVEVLGLTWPQNTPVLPTCSPAVPETCLASGRQIAAELGALPGAREEAMRQLTTACDSGVHRGCYEAVGLEDPTLASRASACVGGDLKSCNEVSKQRLDLDPQNPSPVTVGLLEYSCTLEGSGTLGQRLRRIEDVGAGCMMLVGAYDALKQPDQALLNLDQACVLGRSDACDEAAKRRQAAFAARTVRECEDPNLPNAASCVDLGKLLQKTPVAAATLDDFGAFLRGCTLGAAEGCLLLGDYVDRWGIQYPRVMEAEKQLLDSCNAGENRACLGAGDLLVRHEPRTDAYGQALLLFDRACKAGIGAACVDGANQRRMGQARKVEAPPQVQMWTSACSFHSADGCAGLGTSLSKVKSSWPAAYDAWTQACDLGSPGSCTDLGQFVGRRHEPPFQGEQPTNSYLSRGCDNGDPRGCFLLAETTFPPKGQPDEPTYLLLEKSCDGDYGPGCAKLADVHIDRHTSFDDEIAARHYDTACEHGDYDSCKQLGLMYLKGQGVERDRAKANELLDRFRLNARSKYLRLGVQIGLPSAAGGEAELLLPIPFGPGIAISGMYSYVPEGGALLYALRKADGPKVPPPLQVVGGAVRVFPNHQGRGVYLAGGIQKIQIVSDRDTSDFDRLGWSARFGMRNDAKFLYSGVEFGLGQYGEIHLHDFDTAQTRSFPLIVPTLAVSFGLAPI